MPVPVVVVEVAPPLPDAQATILEETCSKAVRQGRCVLSKPVQEAEPARAIVIVSWQDSDTSLATIQVGVRHEQRVHWATRELHFEPRDARDERWRTVGLTIAILLGELPAAEEEISRADISPKPKAAAKTPKPLAEPQATAETAGKLEPHRRAQSFLEGLVFAGPGLADGGMRTGFSLRAGYTVAPINTSVYGTLAYAFRPSETDSLSTQWSTVGIGALIPWRLTQPDMKVEAGLAVAFERLSVTAEEPATDSGARWLWLGAAHLGLVYPADRKVSISFQAALRWVQNPFTIYNAANVVGEVASVDYLVHVGPRLNL